jgi:hypothetical protein
MKHRAAGLLAEPTVRFFAVGALLFVAHRLVAGNPRVIVVTGGVKAEVERRFRDQHGRAPSPPELDGELRTWERDEALYREALRDGLDRDDGTVRAVLTDRVRARAALGVTRHEPTGAELERWLAEHRSLYETPRRYDYGIVTFPRTERSAAAERERYERELNQGGNPMTAARPIVGATLTADELGQRVGAELAARIRALPVAQWQRLETEQALLLVRLNAVTGGLPAPDELHGRLLADWMYADRKQAVDRAVQAIVDRYRFEQRR